MIGEVHEDIHLPRAATRRVRTSAGVVISQSPIHVGGHARVIAGRVTNGSQNVNDALRFIHADSQVQTIVPIRVQGFRRVLGVGDFGRSQFLRATSARGSQFFHPSAEPQLHQLPRENLACIRAKGGLPTVALVST